MRLNRRIIWTVVALLAVGVVSWFAGMRHALPRQNPELVLVHDAQAFRAALEHYRADHGWYPCDPDRDYNSDGRAEVLRRQLTEFTRDDGKPADRRDAQYCFGPYLPEIPADPLSGSRHIVVDQDQARALARLRRDIATGNGRGGWYYEARTGNLVANRGGARYAGF